MASSSEVRVQQLHASFHEDAVLLTALRHSVAKASLRSRVLQQRAATDCVALALDGLRQRCAQVQQRVQQIEGGGTAPAPARARARAPVVVNAGCEMPRPSTTYGLTLVSYNVLLPNSIDGWWTYK